MHRAPFSARCAGRWTRARDAISADSARPGTAIRQRHQQIE
jgi:hypothetical protein